jgi:hypothetical protein
MRVWEALKEGTEKLLKAFAPVFYLWIVLSKILWIVLSKILCIVLNYRTSIMWSLKTSTNALTSDLLSFSIIESYCGDYYYCCCASVEKGTAIRIPIKRIAAASNADGSSCISW